MLNIIKIARMHALDLLLSIIVYVKWIHFAQRSVQTSLLCGFKMSIETCNEKIYIA